MKFTRQDRQKEEQIFQQLDSDYRKLQDDFQAQVESVESYKHRVGKLSETIDQIRDENKALANERDAKVSQVTDLTRELDRLRSDLSSAGTNPYVN
jgi:uncharacterized protein YoxC